MTIATRLGCTVAAMSPKVHVEDGFQFWFWSNEQGEPPHIHVFKGGASAKWWLDPLVEDRSSGFNPSQRARIRSILREQQSAILERWHGTFG